MVHATNEIVTVWNTCVNPHSSAQGDAVAKTQHDGQQKRPKFWIHWHAQRHPHEKASTDHPIGTRLRNSCPRLDRQKTKVAQIHQWASRPQWWLRGGTPGATSAAVIVIVMKNKKSKLRFKTQIQNSNSNSNSDFNQELFNLANLLSEFLKVFFAADWLTDIEKIFWWLHCDEK